MKNLFIGVVFLCTLNFAFGWSKAGTVYTTTGSLSDVNSAITDATVGDTVNVPSGTFTWGAGGTSVAVNKVITLAGAGEGSTIIQLSATGPYYGGGAISITAAAHVYGMTITGIANTVGGPSSTPISIGGANGWRVNNITFNGSADPGYFIYFSAANGLVDHCTINGASGSLQVFMIRGATSVWSNPHTMGTANAVYIEDNTFNNCSYANENDGGAQSVIRFNTMNSGAYLDAHMIETSTDASGVAHASRQLEAYNNTYTSSATGYYAICQLNGGTSIVFDNTGPVASSGDPPLWPVIMEWGANTGVAGNLPWIPTPAHSPIPDQNGTGAYPQSAGQEPVYFFHNTRTDGTVLNLFGASVHAAAISAYGSTFFMNSEDGSPYMFLRGRDYLRDASGGSFPSTSDIGRGTKAAMLASSPTAARQGWWVTDEASWRSGFSGTSGQLYKWNGSAWVLYYTPYTYPHPLQSGGGGDTTAPIPNPATISGPPTHTSTTISVTATTTTDAGSPPVLYRFSRDSGSTWTAYQSSASYTFTGLTVSTTYQIKVQAEDSAGTPNVTAASSATGVTTDATSTDAPPRPPLRRSPAMFGTH